MNHTERTLAASASLARLHDMALRRAHELRQQAIDDCWQAGLRALRQALVANRDRRHRNGAAGERRQPLQPARG